MKFSAGRGPRSDIPGRECDRYQADAKETHMLKFYYSGAPNPTKVALFLEETGTAYEPIPIDTRKG